VDANNFREMLGKSRRTSQQPSPIGATPDKPSQTKMPAIHRTISAPVSSTSFVKETPPVSKKSALRQVENSTPSGLEISVVEETQMLDTPSGTPRPGTERRTVSDPALGAGFLKLNHSAGIESMLGRKRLNTAADNTSSKKKARKSTTIKLVPEGQRIFENQVFYWVPPNEKDSLRKRRITKARERGATWTQELIPETTHIVVDEHLTYKDVINFLKLESIPQNMILVYDKYVVECIAEKFLLDHDQKQYEVREPGGIGAMLPPVGTESQVSDVSLKVKGFHASKKPGFSSSETPPRSQVVMSEDTPQSPMARPAEAVALYSVGTNQDLQIHNSGSEDVAGSPFISDEFDDIIQQARVHEALYLSEEGEESESIDSGSDSDSRRSNLHTSRKHAGNGTQKNVLNQDNFSCMKGGTGNITTSNPNWQTIELLQQMSDHYERIKDQWRHRAYQKTIGVLKKLPNKVYTYDEAIELPGVGDRLAKKIEQIALTGRLKRLDYAQQEPGDATLQLFMKIYGVGLSQGGKWVQQGYKSLQDLMANAKLNDNQRIGIEHYEDLNTRIPRDEVTALGEVVKTATASIDPKVQVIIGGSYRRGAATSGDIDCLMTKPGTSKETDLLPLMRELVQHLTESGFLVCSLAAPSDTGSKWHGCCVLPGSPKPIWRRIDFLLVPETQLGAALIYFTGDDIFNRSIRLLASKKGCRLNQRGLYKDVMRGPGRAKMTEGLLIEGADERKIFEALGVPYRPPEQRICS